MADLAPAIELLEIAARELSKHMRACLRCPSLSRVRREAGLAQYNADRLASYRLAVDTLREAAAAQPDAKEAPRAQEAPRASAPTENNR